MLIIISGMPGSGKSTVARHISKKLKLDYVSAGGLFREIAEEKGYSNKGGKFVKWNEHVKLHPEIDKEIDKKIMKRARKGDVVVDSWLAGHLIKKADLKIFLKIDMNSAIERITLREELTKKEVSSQTKHRLKVSEERWKKLYGVDINNLNPFDFVFDTTRFSQIQMKRIIDLVLKSLLENQNIKKVHTRRCEK